VGETEEGERSSKQEEKEGGAQRTVQGQCPEKEGGNE
jgi:hypothetical protein